MGGSPAESPPCPAQLEEVLAQVHLPQQTWLSWRCNPNIKIHAAPRRKCQWAEAGMDLEVKFYSESQRSKKSMHQHLKTCPPPQLQPVDFSGINKGCQLLQRLVLPLVRWLAMAPRFMCWCFWLCVSSTWSPFLSLCSWIYILPQLVSLLSSHGDPRS